MYKLRNYIIKHFSILFVSMFLPLFAIASVVFLIKLATYTAVIQLSIWEMTQLYIFTLPEILFYTLPITFFVAATLTLFRLSNDNEIIVLFSLGIHPKFLLRVLLKPALLLSILLAFNFFVIFPHAKVLSSNMITFKKSEAKFNLSASEFGHSFGDWLLYIGAENKDGSYGDVFLFNKKKEEEILISANQAEVINDGGVLRLKLSDGEGYSYSKEKFTQIDFETMFINDTMKTDLTAYEDTLGYWLSEHRRDKKITMFITDTLLSLFPLLCLFLVLSIGIIHARHQKSKTYLYLFLGIVIFYGSTIGLQKVLSFYTIPIVAFVWLGVTYFMYRKMIVARF
ncbi:MAG: LptF/LptG family permease [Sulfurimonas sp.]|nr:LptF/LptG family permease [Sulfurimonas sp.]